MEEGHAEGGESKNAESAGEKKKKKKDNGEVNFDDFVNWQIPNANIARIRTV